MTSSSSAASAGITPPSSDAAHLEAQSSSPLTLSERRESSVATLQDNDVEATAAAAAAAAAATPSEKKSNDDDKRDPNIVDWTDDNDPENPRNWSFPFRALCTLELAMLAMTASMSSSIISPAAGVIATEFNISEQIAVFNVSLYVLGFAFGPLIWAGVSETFGRRWSLLPAMCGLALFSIGTATSHSASAMFATRFFGGIFGSAPVSNVGAAMGDMYAPKARGIAISLYALAVVGGPTIGPVIGAALTIKASWRWAEYLIAIMAFFFAATGAFILPETYAPVLLKHRAQKLRKQTGNTALYHPHERVKLDVRSIVSKQIARPLRMLFTEPIVTVIACYASFVYALLYCSLQFLSIIYGELRHWPLITTSASFLALFVGILCALVVNLGNSIFYARAVDRAGGKPVPDARLPPMFIGALLFCGGLFWLGWTAEPAYAWILPIIATAFIGAGFNIVFQQCINFLVDSYTLYAASAISANTFLRSVLAAALPFAVRPMFAALGVAKAMTVLGAISAIAIPLPFVFMHYGARLRQRSKFAQQ